MENKLKELGTKLKESWETLGEKLNEQQWFQELRGKWDELDPQSRTYLKLATVGGSALLFLILVGSSVWGVHKLKRELAEKADLLVLLQGANDELRRLKEANSAAAAGAEAGGPWSVYFEGIASGSGIDKASLTVGSEKPGNTTDSSKEALVDVSIRHVSIKQIVRFTYALENGSRPAKLRNLTIDTKNDPSGYLDANLAVSGFTLATK